MSHIYLDANSIIYLVEAVNPFHATVVARLLSYRTKEIIERATDLRVRYNFKTPDAIHLATAIDEKSDLFTHWRQSPCLVC